MSWDDDEITPGRMVREPGGPGMTSSRINGVSEHAEVNCAIDLVEVDLAAAVRSIVARLHDLQVAHPEHADAADGRLADLHILLRSIRNQSQARARHNRNLARRATSR